MIKAVFIDIDGTLADSERNISEKNKEEIRRCVSKGIKVILTSGRSRKEVLERQEQTGASPYIVSSNGASAYDVQKKFEIYNEPLKRETVKKLLDYSVKNNYRIRLNYKDELVINKAFYTDEKDNVRTIEELEQIINSEKILQCVIQNNDLEKMKQFKKYLKEKMPDVKVANESKKLKNPNLKPSKNYYCDITSKWVSKGEAVASICNYLKIDKDQIVTIGDGENDISMFNITPNSVAMGNALPNIKEKAKYITLSNDENGVAKILGEL